MGSFDHLSDDDERLKRHEDAERPLKTEVEVSGLRLTSELVATDYGMFWESRVCGLGARGFTYARSPLLSKAFALQEVADDLKRINRNVDDLFSAICASIKRGNLKIDVLRLSFKLPGEGLYYLNKKLEGLGFSARYNQTYDTPSGPTIREDVIFIEEIGDV